MLTRRYLDRPIIWEAALDVLPLSTSANAADLRAALAAMGLTLTRASSATVQTSASEVVTTGIGVDDPRVGRYGLVIEEARTNLFPSARSVAGIAVGSNDTISANYAAGPDGVASADRHQILSAGYSNYFVPGSLAARTFSVWIRHATASGPSCIAIEGSSALNSTADVRTVDTTWQRVSLYRASGQYYLLNDGRTNYPGTTAGARDVVIDIVQVEAGAFATEAILTTGAAATRAGERLAIDTSARLVRSGRIGIEIRFVPKFANTDITGSWAYLWSLDGNNQAYLQKSDNKIRVWSNGASFTTTLGPSWSAGDTVDMWIEAGGGSLVTRVVYRVNGGAATVLGTSGAPQASLVSGTGASFLSEVNTTSQSSSWVQRIRAYAPGRRPQWAA